MKGSVDDCFFNPYYTVSIMPEGPEVRIESNKLNRVLSGKVPDSIWFEKTSLKKKSTTTSLIVLSLAKFSVLFKNST